MAPDSIPFIAYFNPLVALYSIFPSQGPGMDIFNNLIAQGRGAVMLQVIMG